MSLCESTNKDQSEDLFVADLAKKAFDRLIRIVDTPNNEGNEETQETKEKEKSENEEKKYKGTKERNQSKYIDS